MDHAERLHEALVVTRRGYIQVPDLRAIERDDWMQIITPSYKDGMLNEISYSVMRDDEADTLIDRAIAEYRSQGIKFRWRVGPDSRPLDLGARLAKRGLVRHSSRLLVRTTNPLPGANRDGLRVEHVARGPLLDAFTDVTARGWNIPPGPLDSLHRLILDSPKDDQHMFVAFDHDVPVATGSYVAFEKSAQLRGGVVVPEHRGKGAYRALVRARIDHARARGIGLVTTAAQADTSAPRLERMGFEEVCAMEMYTG